MIVKRPFRYIYLGFLFMLMINIHAQKAFKIVYAVKPFDPIEKGKIYDPAVKAILKGGEEYAKKNKYTLITHNKNSYFRQNERIDVDFDDIKNQIFSRSSQSFTNFNHNVYVDFKNNSFIFSKNLAGKYYVIKKDEFHNFNWDIKKETKIIAGLKAQKAVGTYYDIFFEMNREIIVWFIPSIPIPAGPDIYFGLPGLVGEVQLRKAIVKIESIEEYNESVRQPTFKDVMSYEDYLDFVTKANAKIKKEYN